MRSPIKLHIAIICTIGVSFSAGAKMADVSKGHALKLRGMVTINETTIFSIHDAEAGQSYWLKPGQAWGALNVIEYSSGTGLLKVSWYDRMHNLKIEAPSETSIAVISSQKNAKELSQFNQKLLRVYKELIRSKVSKQSGRLIRDHRSQEALRKYIQGNPSVAELSDFLFAELEGSADVDKFLGLDFPKESVPNRSAENTPGWDLKDDITYDDIVELLGSNPTTEELLATKKVQPQAN